MGASTASWLRLVTLDLLVISMGDDDIKAKLRTCFCLHVRQPARERFLVPDLEPMRLLLFALALATPSTIVFEPGKLR
jgi:hypothetical protein